MLPSQTPTNPSSHILPTKKTDMKRDKIIQNHHQLIFFSFPKKSIATPRYTVSAAPLRPASRASEPFESSASHRRGTTASLLVSSTLGSDQCGVNHGKPSNPEKLAFNSKNIQKTWSDYQHLDTSRGPGHQGLFLDSLTLMFLAFHSLHCTASPVQNPASPLFGDSNSCQATWRSWRCISCNPWWLTCMYIYIWCECVL